ncbi:MAG: cadmium-translocating P-type ATPase [Saprospirales bacterium]|nr:MAG: cadmium-translocating P-type ATPase [Saprospirales bacterium]
MKNIDWNVEGMSCGGCVQKVRQQLEKCGAENIYIDLASGEVEFTVEEGRKGVLDQLKRAVQKLGFSVRDEQAAKEPVFSLKWKLILATIFTLPLLLGHMLMMTPLPMPDIFMDRYFQLIVCLPVYLIGLQHFGTSALGAIRSGTSNMDVLIFMGTTAAFFYSLTGTIINEPNYLFYETAATIITLVLAGNFIEKRAIKSTTSSINDLIKLQRIFALKLTEDGITRKIPASEIKVGDQLLVNEGDQVPCDGVISEGHGNFDESLLTGESMPVFKKEGDTLVGASLLVNGNVTIKATAVGGDSFLGKLIKLVKSAQNSKSGLQILADKISAVFVPLVILISILTFTISWFLVQIPLQNAIMNSVAVLVIACPCAMGLATPTAVMVGVGRAAKLGILPRRGDSFERLVGINFLVLDKTGTLTEGNFAFEGIDFTDRQMESEALSVIYQLERRSNHPLARAINDHFNKEGWTDTSYRIRDIKEIAGYGVKGYSPTGEMYSIGGAEGSSNGLHRISLKKDGREIAKLTLADKLKEEAVESVQYFNKLGIETILLSGDREETTREVAEKLGINTYYSMHSPEQKLKVIEDYTKKGLTAMVGDGVNDSVALARADIGIAFSSTATLAMQSADLVLLNEKIDTLVNTHKLSRKTVTTIRQNLFWAFSYNIVAIPMAALGFLNPMAAAFFMAFSDLVVIGNSVRLKYKKI